MGHTVLQAVDLVVIAGNIERLADIAERPIAVLAITDLVGVLPPGSGGGGSAGSASQCQGDQCLSRSCIDHRCCASSSCARRPWGTDSDCLGLCWGTSAQGVQRPNPECKRCASRRASRLFEGCSGTGTYVSPRTPSAASGLVGVLVNDAGLASRERTASNRSRPPQRDGWRCSRSVRRCDVHVPGCRRDRWAKSGAVRTGREAIAMVVDCSDYEVVFVIIRVGGCLLRTQSSLQRCVQCGVAWVYRTRCSPRTRQHYVGGGCTGWGFALGVIANVHPRRGAQTTQRGRGAILPLGDWGAAVAAVAPRQGDTGRTASGIVIGTRVQVGRGQGLGARINRGPHRGNWTGTCGVYSSHSELIRGARGQTAHCVALVTSSIDSSGSNRCRRHGHPFAVVAITSLLRILVPNDR